jgi:hypothetical protein
MPTTQRSGCRLNVTFSTCASRNAQASIVHPVLPAVGNCTGQARHLARGRLTKNMAMGWRYQRCG